MDQITTLLRTWMQEALLNRIVLNTIDNSLLIHIPAGPFTMGDGQDHDSPKHQVNLSGYWIGMYCVTKAQYAKFMQLTGYKLVKHKALCEPIFNPKLKDGEHPVVCISWQDAKAYAEWAKCTLPTEAQWEKAARWKPSPSGRGQGEGAYGSRSAAGHTLTPNPSPRGRGRVGALFALGDGTAMKDWIAAGLVLGVAALAGHPQTFLFVLATTAVYFVFRVWQSNSKFEIRNSKFMARILGAIALLALIAFGIAAIQWIPAIEYQQLSTREALSFADAAKGFPTLEILQFILPGYTNAFASPLYVGILPLWLALFALLKRRNETIFWGLLALGALILAFGFYVFAYVIFYLFVRLIVVELYQK